MAVGDNNDTAASATSTVVFTINHTVGLQWVDLKRAFQLRLISYV